MSENILKELCNRVLSLFKQTENQEENAKEVACNRLRVVLMQDRTNLTPELLQRMRKELVELLSKYVEMDKDALELNLDQEGDQMALMLSIPVIRAKDEAEIEEALKAEDEADSEDSEKESTEEEDSEDSEEEIIEDNEESEEAVEDDETEETQEEDK
ncbi:MAG: cell division topological specificity factor MinE [Muribaculaceae bacterium]|nr:cell division topological specificity factor MinE [Muribaculaceae bacterium]